MNDLYGRLMPSSKKQLNDKAEYLKKQTDALEKKLGAVQKTADRTEKKLESQMDAQEKAVSVLEKRISGIEEKIDQLLELLQHDNYYDRQSRAIVRASNEAVWADVFHDAIAESAWLKHKTFYPGRWAAGYQFLYVLYRILNDFHPKDILELGLGQTTRMIGQYVSYEKDCRHTVVEHDQEWIDIFKKDFCLAGNSEIVRLDIEKKSFEGTESTTVYVDFAARFRDRKFDLISIDAPFGGNTLTYSRMDILELLPGCLKEDFVILLDDYNRPAERNMIEKLKGILKDNGISFHTGVYRGNKDTFIVSSEKLRFLCTM